MENYTTIEQTAHAEFKDRGSKFIAYAHPFTDAKDFKRIILKYRKEHPKAAHHCFAYRVGINENNFRSGDGGEPAGTAGKQILGQIDSNYLTDILIIVVRYFGGTLLGIPGLINAFKTSASLLLQVVPYIKKKVIAKYKLEFDYTQMNEVMIILKQHHCIIYKQEMELFLSIEVGIALTDVNAISDKIKKLRKVEMIQCV